MADEPTPSGRKKINPLFFAGPAVALIGGVSAVLLTMSDKQGPLAGVASGTPQPAASGNTVAQPAQLDQAVPDTPQPPPAEASSAISPDGASIAFSDETITFSAALPTGSANDPNLASLRKDAQNYLASKKAEARSQYEEFKKLGGGPPAWPWEVKIEWNYTAKAGDIVSLFGTSYEFTGGAHGMTRFDALIARTSGMKLSVAGMLQGGLSPAIIIAMCEALKVEKKKRIDAATIFDEPIVCAGPNANVKIEKAKLVLAPSNQAGRFGGLYAFYEPYEVGSYAEGSYAITIPQEIFAQDLKPEFKSLFAGDPPPPEN